VAKFLKEKKVKEDHRPLTTGFWPTAREHSQSRHLTLLWFDDHGGFAQAAKREKFPRNDVRILGPRWTRGTLQVLAAAAPG